MNNVLIYSLIKKLSIGIDRLISSSQDSNPNIALGNLSNKIDTLKQNVDTKAKQETVNKVGQALEDIGSILSNKVDKVERAINTKASQSSVNEVWQEIGDKAGTITRKIGTVEGKVDTKADKADINNLNSRLNTLKNETSELKRIIPSNAVWTNNLAHILGNHSIMIKKEFEYAEIVITPLKKILDIKGVGTFNYLEAEIPGYSQNGEFKIVLDGKTLFYLEQVPDYHFKVRIHTDDGKTDSSWGANISVSEFKQQIDHRDGATFNFCQPIKFYKSFEIYLQAESEYGENRDDRYKSVCKVTYCLEV